MNFDEKKYPFFMCLLPSRFQRAVLSTIVMLYQLFIMLHSSISLLQGLLPILEVEGTIMTHHIIMVAAFLPFVKQQ
jgi:hypothetical protein